MDYRELTTRSTTQEATLSNSIGGFVKGVGDRRARVVQHYALIIASWAHGNCDWAAEILTHAINRLEVARLQLCTD